MLETAYYEEVLYVVSGFQRVAVRAIMGCAKCKHLLGAERFMLYGGYVRPMWLGTIRYTQQCAKKLEELYGQAMDMEIEQNKKEVKRLIIFLAGMRPKKIMEIGTAKGGTLFLLGKIFDPDLLISVDLPHGRYGGIGTENDERYKTFGRDVRIIRGNSHDASTLKIVTDILNGEKLDFLFIDGDHTYEGARRDFEDYRALVREGGVIAFHDIVEHDPRLDCHVDEFWKRVKKVYNGFDIVADRKHGRFGIGVVVMRA